MRYQVIAFYHFVEIKNPHEEVELHKNFFESRDIASRIYVSESGINGQMSASEADGNAYMEWMHSRPLFHDVHFKLHYYHEHPFPRKTVKYRKNLVGHDQPIDLHERGKHVTPEEWKKMMEDKEKYLLLDIRNDYEWKIGRFDGAELPPCETFRDFEKYADTISDENKKQPVMMYCTGGIRCELYSAILKNKGFGEVYQLDGGIINYGLKEGNDHWLGKLFVFDDRLAVPIAEGDTPIIGTCFKCSEKCESYYNCANIDCNELFICCDKCIAEYGGCCSLECKGSERVRPYNHQSRHKPFRRKHFYENNLQNSCNVDN